MEGHEQIVAVCCLIERLLNDPFHLAGTDLLAVSHCHHSLVERIKEGSIVAIS